MSVINFVEPIKVVVSAVDYAPAGVCGPRVQGDVQLVMMDRGSLRLTTEGVEQTVMPGQVVCQWPGMRETFAFDLETVSSHRWVALTFDTSAKTRRWLTRLSRRAARQRRESSAMRRLFDTAFALKQTDDPEVRVARVHLAWAYFAAYLVGDGSDGRVVGSPLPSAVSAMQDAIAERYAEPLTLDDLAETASVSTNHLARLCRKHLHTTPMRLLWDTRVDHGVELLRNTGLTVSEIAYRVGFASPFHFSRLCKARHGISPRQLRQQAWANG